MPSDDFSAWLQTATRGLPKNVVSQVYDELFAHYEDAVDGYLLAGKSQGEAQSAALIDLGDVEETARALRHIHLAPRRYALAGTASIAPYILLIGYALLLLWDGTSYASSLIFFYPLTFCCTMFVLNSFNTLLPFQGLKLPLRIMTAGILAVLLLYVALLFSSQYVNLLLRWGMVNFNEPTLNYNFAPIQTNVDLMIDACFVIASVLMAGGGIWAGQRLLNVGDALHHVTGMAFGLHGVVVLMQIAALLANNVVATGTITMAITLLGIIKYAACALLFFRAARIDSAFPTHTA